MSPFRRPASDDRTARRLPGPGQIDMLGAAVLLVCLASFFWYAVLPLFGLR